MSIEDFNANSIKSSKLPLVLNKFKNYSHINDFVSYLRDLDCDLVVFYTDIFKQDRIYIESRYGNMYALQAYQELNEHELLYIQLFLEEFGYKEYVNKV